MNGMKDRLRRLEHLHRGRVRQCDLSHMTDDELLALEKLPRDGTPIATYAAGLTDQAADLLARALSSYNAAPLVRA